jgi:LysM repeat protein
MEYTIKSGDTLSKIAAKFKVPLSSLLATNPQITSADHISVGQVIHIPNMQDVPPDAVFVDPITAPQLILRARSMVNSSILYHLGSGGMHPKDLKPTRDGLCDCSGFICWVIGLSRKTDISFYTQNWGGWISTDSMEADVNSPTGIFERLQRPEPGCIVVYGAGPKLIGHVGLVSEVANSAMKKVIHCSSGNSKTFRAAIQETTPTVFNRPDAIWGRFAR